MLSRRGSVFPPIWFFSGNLDKQTALGNTALHYCSMFEKPECLKLLLRSKPTVDVGERVRGSAAVAGLSLPAACNLTMVSAFSRSVLIIHMCFPNFSEPGWRDCPRHSKETESHPV